MTIEFVDEPADGRAKYGPILADVRHIQSNDPDQAEKWAELNAFVKEQSARDAATRLKGEYPEFEFISRKDGKVTRLLARLKEEHRAT